MPDMQTTTTLTRNRIIPIVVSLSVLLGQSAGAAGGQQTGSGVKIDLEQAIQLAIAHNHALKATRTLIQQSQAQEITAAIRPNPVLDLDGQPGLPLSAGQFTGTNLNNVSELDAGATFTFERGHKRQARVRAAQDATAVTRSQISESARALTFNVAQQFLAVLLAKSNLQLAQQDLKSFQDTVDISQARLKAGNISEGDFLKIKLQLLQFQNDVSSAQLGLLQARNNLRALLGYDAVPADFDVAGDLAYTPLHGNREDMQVLALSTRPDYLAAQRSVTAAQSQYQLARANGKRDLTSTFLYTHTAGLSAVSLSMNIEIPIWDRNQGEIARTHYAITQAQESKTAAGETVMTDVAAAYEAAKTGEQVVQLYESGYLKNARDSRDISEYAYKRGAASLLDYLDAERSYRATQLAYRQSLATYMLALEQLREAVGQRNLP